MPVRLLREGILDSTAVNALSFPAEVFYRRLMSVVDDFGRFDGRLAVLRCRLYSLKVETVREADIAGWVAECAAVGLVSLYAVDADGRARWVSAAGGGAASLPNDQKPYLLLHKLGPARAKASKCPPPPDGVPHASESS